LRPHWSTALSSRRRTWRRRRQETLEGAEKVVEWARAGESSGVEMWMVMDTEVGMD